MAMQAVHEFYKAGNRNAELLKTLLKDVAKPEDFLRNAVVEGNRQGYGFTYAEADDFVKSMQAAVAKQTSGGELSDMELELVAGGKSADNPLGLSPSSGPNDSRTQGWNSFWRGWGETYGGFLGAMNSIGSWFSSW